MTVKDYCSKVCGAKCCRIASMGISCPELKNNVCQIYKARFKRGKPYSFAASVKDPRLDWGRLTKVFDCKPVRERIESGELSEKDAAACCIAHPELLKAI